MPDFAGLQLCEASASAPSADGWVHEIKFDGYRIQMRIENGDVTLKTRKQLDWTEKFSAIAKAAAKLPDAIIDGEIVALNSKGDPDFSAMQAALSDGNTDDLVFFAFDLLFAEGEDLRPLPLLERKERLRKLLGRSAASNRAPIRYVEHFDADGEQMLASAHKAGLEGIVSKRVDAPYRAGRGGSWLKVKSRPGHEVVIGGWKTTSGKFRSLMAGVYDGDRLVYTGIVGTGYGRDTVKRIMPALKKAAASKSPFSGKNAPAGGREVHWLKPELVAEIEFAGWTNDGMVRQAAFKGLRTDKPAREVKAEKPTHKPVPRLDAQAAARSHTDATRSRQPRTSSARDRAVVMGVAISKPDKALWPDAGDDTPVTLLGNGDGSRTGHFWVYLRDDRSSGDMSPPAVAFRFSADRGGVHPAQHLAGYQGYLQADGFAGYNALYRDPRTKAPRDIVEVGCWSHARRKFTDILDKSPSPIAAEAVVRIAELFAIERDIKGAPPDERKRIRLRCGLRRPQPVLADLAHCREHGVVNLHFCQVGRECFRAASSDIAIGRHHRGVRDPRHLLARHKAGQDRQAKCRRLREQWRARVLRWQATRV